MFDRSRVLEPHEIKRGYRVCFWHHGWRTGMVRTKHRNGDITVVLVNARRLRIGKGRKIYPVMAGQRTASDLLVGVA